MWQQDVRTIGITDACQDGIDLHWSASGIEFETTARRVSVEIASESACDEENAFLGVFYDGNIHWDRRIRIMPGRHWYEICGNENEHDEHERGVHRTIRLLRLTEEQYGTLRITSVRADAPLTPTQAAGRQILFVGDSLTAGFGVTGIDGISVFQTADEDVTLGYSYLAGAALGTENTFVAYGGNGVLSRWIPPEVDTAVTQDILPSIFPYERIGSPYLVVCNLGTNDASYTRGIPEREDAFVERYCAFVERLHEAAPGAEILLTYGLMERTLCGAEREVARRCGADYLELPLQNAAYGMGTLAHPNARTHEETAQFLRDYISRCY